MSVDNKPDAIETQRIKSIVLDELGETWAEVERLDKKGKDPIFQMGRAFGIKDIALKLKIVTEEELKQALGKKRA